MKVYIVTSGQWSDYSIEGVFATELEAIKYIQSGRTVWYNYRIELYEDDKQLKTVKLDEDGKIISI